MKKLPTCRSTGQGTTLGFQEALLWCIGGVVPCPVSFTLARLSAKEAKIDRILHVQVGIFAALCALLVVGCSPSPTSSPSRAEESFLSLLKDGRHLEAQDRLSSTELKKIVSLRGGITNENLTYCYRSDYMQAFEILSVESSTESARAHVRVVTKDGLTHENDINFVREDGKWLVSDFKLLNPDFYF
ncbi:MAG: hypothetical protein K6360_02245 [Deltaproteobacteria bacterium]